MTSCTSLIVLILVVANVYRVSAKYIATEPSADIFTKHIDNNDNNNKNLSPAAYKVIASRSLDVPESENSHDRIKPSKYIVTGPSANIFTEHLDNNDNNNNKNLSPGAYKVIASRSTDIPKLENSHDNDIQEYPEIVEVISEEIYEVRKHRVIKRIQHRNKASSKKKDEKAPNHENSTYRFSITSKIDNATNSTNASSVESFKTTTPPVPNFTNSSTTPTSLINKQAIELKKLPMELKKFSRGNPMHETFGDIDKVVYYTTDKNHYEITTDTPKLNIGTTSESISTNSSGSLPSTTSEPASSLGTPTPVASTIPKLILSTTSESAPSEIATPVPLIKSESVQLVTSEPISSTSPKAVSSTTFEPVSLENSTTILLTNPESVSSITFEPVASTSFKPVLSTTLEPVVSTTLESVSLTTVQPIPSTTLESVASTTLESVASTTVQPIPSSTLEPVASTTRESVASTTVEPVLSTTFEPVVSTTLESVASTTVLPIPSTTFEPVASTTLESVASKTVEPVLSTTLPPPAPENRNFWEKFKSKLSNSWW